MLSLALLTGCSAIGGFIYDIQMCSSDAVQMDDGSWSDLDLMMSDSEKSCMAETCSDARADQDTYTACFKEKCRSSGDEEAPARKPE